MANQENAGIHRDTRSQKTTDFQIMKTKGKGSNPNSQKNLKPRAKTKKACELTKSTSITLNQEQIDSIKALGDGNLSEGIKILNRVYSRTYPDCLLYPQSLILEMELAIKSGDTKWQPHLDYLYSVA